MLPSMLMIFRRGHVTVSEMLARADSIRRRDVVPHGVRRAATCGHTDGGGADSVRPVG